MARLARIVIPGIPHHVTQRGNGRQTMFFSDDDYAVYRDLLREHAAGNGVAPCGDDWTTAWRWGLYGLDRSKTRARCQAGQAWAGTEVEFGALSP